MNQDTPAQTVSDAAFRARHDWKPARTPPALTDEVEGCVYYIKADGTRGWGSGLPLRRNPERYLAWCTPLPSPPADINSEPSPPEREQCSMWLGQQGHSYPRTCKVCGLGPCRVA